MWIHYDTHNTLFRTIININDLKYS